MLPWAVALVADVAPMWHCCGEGRHQKLPFNPKHEKYKKQKERQKKKKKKKKKTKKKKKIQKMITKKDMYL